MFEKLVLVWLCFATGALGFFVAWLFRLFSQLQEDVVRSLRADNKLLSEIERMLGKGPQ